MINYKHLHYFWVVAKHGGIARAGERLHLTPQTISGQISVLEDSIGEALFSKAGRNLELTETGRLVLSYADEIFSLGGELEAALRNRPPDRQMTFKVGIADVVPKTIAYRLLAPALSMSDPVRIICRENNLANLLAELVPDLLVVRCDDHQALEALGLRGRLRLPGHRQAEDRRQPRLDGEDPLGRLPHGEPLALPAGHAAVGLQRGVRLHLGAESRLDDHVRGG
mgnify:CR=1 FL=1